ncbi:uncharacterized protein LOC141629544 [Silene latifolia]|uniref:uncharacterized protein LOC141629544 n=1 Tax=Silene latifolia TaxID=37657 RepID=UPI003D78AF32
MFAPLLDKIRLHIGHWANSLLSYAGKIQLINSVIFGLQNFWGSSVLLPKGIVKKINKLCKDFVWGIEEGHTKLTFKSWDSFCFPREEGGVDIKEVLSWNRAQLLLWLYKLVLHSDTIWVRWVEAYILKGTSLWDFKLTSAYSWFWGSIISCRDLLVQHLGGPLHASLFLQGKDYKTCFYEMIRPKGTPFAHCKTVWDPLCFPKHRVIGLLAIQNRLPTIDNLCKRGLVLVNRCALCESSLETISHLYFRCSYSVVVWQAIAFWLHILP